MKDKKWTMYWPVLLVLATSIPLVIIAQWGDFADARELARDVVESSGFFSGFSEDTSTTIDIIPDQVIDTTLPKPKENVTYTDTSGQNRTVIQDTPSKSIMGGVITALFMVGIAVLAAFGIFMLFKLRRKLTLKMFFASALGLCSSVSIMLYLFFGRLNLEIALGIGIPDKWPFYVLIMLIGGAGGFLIIRNMVFRSTEPKRKNPALIAFCILLGPFLAIVLPVWVVVFLLALVAMWDLWAAKRGIIKKMVHLSDQHRAEEHMEARKRVLRQETTTSAGAPSPAPPMKERGIRKKLIEVKAGEDITSYGLYEGKYYSLGIGDFIFFSLLVSMTFKWMMLKLPWMGFYSSILGEVLALEMAVIVMLAILIGLRQTLNYLDKETVMPGLPLSVLWGLLTFIVLAVILQIFNLIGYGSIVNPF